MPNHTANRLIIVGEAGTLTAIKKMVKSKGMAFDFNKIAPMPEALRGTMSPCRIESPEVVASLNASRQVELAKNPKIAELGLSTEEAITQEEYDRRLKEYGAANWYDWSCRHWGTKWNAYEFGEWKKAGKGISLYFETAWSPPLPIIQMLSAKYPKCSFVLEYADEGGGFLGSSVIEGGNIVGETELEWNSTLGIEMRKRLGRYYEEEEEEEAEEKV
jgi:hypothetical protein